MKIGRNGKVKRVVTERYEIKMEFNFPALKISISFDHRQPSMCKEFFCGYTVYTIHV
jgi:hypothetical protein